MFGSSLGNSLGSSLNTGAQANLANQMQAWMALAHSAFDGGAKLVELNMSLGKTRLEQSASTLNRMLLGRPDEFLPLLAKQTRQNYETTMAHYSDVALQLVRSNSDLAKIMNPGLKPAVEDAPTTKVRKA